MIPDEMLEFKVIWRRENEEEIHRGADHQDFEGSRNDWEYTGSMSAAQYYRADILPVAKQVRWNGSIGSKAVKGAGKREFRFKETGWGAIAGQSDAEGRRRKKVVSLTERLYVVKGFGQTPELWVNDFSLF